MTDLICKIAEPVVDAATGQETLEEEDALVLCRACGNAVTHPDFKILRNGGFAHTFANPYGHVFEIGCFSTAQGCVRVSEESDEFPWFQGYVWAVGACSRCRTQLGWIFSSSKESFYGLILDQLVFP